ncbi:MAG: tyrosine-type recombinase/integrase [Ilumatobacteraceae bacterium]
MASIVEKVLNDGSKTYLVRYRTTDGLQRSKQFHRKRDATAYVNLVEVDRMKGSLVDTATEPDHGQRVVGSMVADGHRPAAEHPCPRRPVLPLARAADARHHAARPARPHDAAAVDGQPRQPRRPPKTKASVRSVPPPSFVMAALEEHRSAVGSDLVSASPQGLPIRPALFRRRFWEPAVRRAGVAPLRIHDLRHAAVSLWIAEGAHPRQVAALAGHTSVSVVLDRCSHLYPADDDALITRLERRGPNGVVLAS